MKIDKQKENINKLLKLIEENPDLKIVPMVKTDVVAGDVYDSWMGSWGDSRVDHFYNDDERIYFKEYDFENLVQQVIDNDNDYDPKWDDLTEEEQEKLAEEIVDKYNWVKCIRISIDTP